MSPHASVPGVNGLDWPHKILAQIPDRRNRAKFWEDGLNTGVRVLGMSRVPFTTGKAANLRRGRSPGHQSPPRRTQPSRATTPPPKPSP